MTAYAVAHLRDVPMNDEILEYMRTVNATFTDYGGYFLVHGATPEVMEGEWDGDLIVVAFPDIERARAWYHSDAYQRILPLRARNARSTLLLLDGCAPDHQALDIDRVAALG